MQEDRINCFVQGLSSIISCSLSDISGKQGKILQYKQTLSLLMFSLKRCHAEVSSSVELPAVLVG